MRLTGQLSTWLRPSNRLFYIKPLKSNPGGCSTRRPRRSLRSLPVSIRVPNLLVKSLTLFFVCFLTRVATNKLLLYYIICYIILYYIKAKDQGRERKCSSKKRSSQKFFRRFREKNVSQKIFQALHKILTIKKIVLSSSRGQANFRGLEASRPRPRT